MVFRRWKREADVAKQTENDKHNKKNFYAFTLSILVGNKCDLVDKRQVTYEEAVEEAAHMGTTFLETSAKNKLNVEEALLPWQRRSRNH